MTIIANPLYDSVFKYLMEDEKVARMLLSALLQKDVLELQMRRHEYTSEEKTAITIYRVDFSANVRDKDGKEHIYSVEPMKVVKQEGNLYTFQCVHVLNNAGSFSLSYRMFPKHPELPHRQDFCYVRWFV